MYATKYNFLTVVIIAMLAALLAGRGVFIIQRNQADKTETSLRGQIADLNNQLASAASTFNTWIALEQLWAGMAATWR